MFRVLKYMCIKYLYLDLKVSTLLLCFISIPHEWANYKVSKGIWFKGAHVFGIDEEC